MLKAMTKEQIRAVLDRVLTWPAERQEDAARMLLAMEEEAQSGIYELDEEEAADIDAAEEEIRRGDPRIPHEEVKARLGHARRA